MGLQKESEGAAKKKPRGRPFAKGEDARRAGSARGEGMPEELEGAEENGTLMEAMQHVFSKPKGADRTDQQKAARQWMASDIGRFMSKLADLELKQEQKGGGECPECARRREEEKAEEEDERILMDVLNKAIARANEVARR